MNTYGLRMVLTFYLHHTDIHPLLPLAYRTFLFLISIFFLFVCQNVFQFHMVCFCKSFINNTSHHITSCVCVSCKIVLYIPLCSQSFLFLDHLTIIFFHSIYHYYRIVVVSVIFFNGLYIERKIP